MACTDPIITALTPEEFKAQFWRDFTYIATWDIATTYNTGDQVFYDLNKRFYQCLNDGVVGVLPTDTNNWKAISNFDVVCDLDITNAYAESCINFNSALFSSDQDKILAYLYLSAHFVVNDLNAGGTSGGNVDAGLVNSKSVGNVSVSSTIPDHYLKSGYAFYATTTYGRKYIDMIRTRAIGNMVAIAGGTNA